jgi:hypothetical protein
MWKEASIPKLRYHPGICLERLRKTKKKHQLQQIVPQPRSKCTSHKYQSQALLPHSTCSLLFSVRSKYSLPHFAVKHIQDLGPFLN